MDFKLEPYDPLAKRRAILQDLSGDGSRGERWLPCAWVDYDDVSKEDADRIAEAMVRGLEEHADDPPQAKYVVEWERSDGSTQVNLVRARSGRGAIGFAIPEWDNDVVAVRATKQEEGS